MSAGNRDLIDAIQDGALNNEVPLAETLRKLVALGGQAGSTELREWASHELRGYQGTDVELPDYRKPGAVLQVDAIKANHYIRGQQISPRTLPDPVRQHVGEEVPLGQPIGEIETMLEHARAEGGYLKLTLPSSQDVVALMNHEAGEPLQQIVAVYWSVAASALSGVLDRVRTTLVELVAEMRAGMPEAVGTPPASVADQAVNLVVYGHRARINVSPAQASGEGSHHVESAPTAALGSRWRRIGALIVGFATIVGVLIALAQWQDWGF